MRNTFKLVAVLFGLLVIAAAIDLFIVLSMVHGQGLLNSAVAPQTTANSTVLQNPDYPIGAAPSVLQNANYQVQGE